MVLHDTYLLQLAAALVDGGLELLDGLLEVLRTHGPQGVATAADDACCVQGTRAAHSGGRIPFPIMGQTVNEAKHNLLVLLVLNIFFGFNINSIAINVAATATN